MNTVVSGRLRLAAASAATLLVALGFPQLAQAASHQAGGGTAAASAAKAPGTAKAPGAAKAAGAASTAAAAGAASSANRAEGRAAQSKPSGTDASCPATSSAGAADAAVSAPTRARAIGGSASATVVWCPPSAGASQVVSYTVTASPGGSSVTATVPNDWAIIDGLTNGTSYTFTVTANTKAASGGQAQTTATGPATPQPIAQPRNVLKGASQTVGYDQYSMLIGGKRVYITAGEFDPWRTPSPSLWLDDLQKMKADGYDAVTVYFDWDYNSPAPGVYDFGGVRDYNTFLNMAQQAGLYVIARPGPYINAETDGGGIPSWVLTAPNGYRAYTQPYLSAALQWLSEINPVIAAHQVTNGGNVIAYQVENEYASHGTNAQQYMAAIEQQAKSDGINVPFTFNQCCGSQTFTSGLGAVNISGTDNYPLGFDCANPSNFGQPQSGYPVYAEEPVYLPEYQGGSFDGWGGAGYDDCYTMTGPDFENVYYKDNIIQGATMQSYYMGVGGTNWGWLPAPQVYSSYDYGAGIRETGEIGTPSNPNDIVGSKFGENKLINDFETSVAPVTQTVPAAAPAADNPAITTLDRVNPGDSTQFVYVRQSDATSTATANTHIALNLNPATSYTYDDANSALAYTGNWTHATAGNSNYTGGDYDSTESWSTEAGGAATVTFTGPAVQWIGPKNNNGGIADVSIDGKQVATVDTYSASGKEYKQVLYAASGLSSGSHTLTITVTGNKDSASSADTVVVDAINVPTAAELSGYFPQVPQSGTITLKGRDSRLLVASYKFGGQDLVYSTSEVMTQATIGGQDTALLYDPQGTDGETVLHYTSQPNVSVVAGSVTSTWDASSGDLRLDYVHGGLAEVKITGGGTTPLELLLADTSTAEEFWPETTSAGPVLVEGGYLVRTATVRNGTLSLTGDTTKASSLTVWAAGSVRSVEWNGRYVAVRRSADGALTGTVGGPRAVSLPKLTNWKFAAEAPEAQPGFDDSDWTLADHPVSNASSPSTPVLYASDYGYDHGFTWYRGHFAGQQSTAGSATGVTLTADGISPTGAYSVWLNGAFLGSGSAAGAQSQTFTFPPGSVVAGQDNVIAVLVENTGNPEGPSGEKTGLYKASLTGSTAPVTWRLMGDPGGSTLQDPVRGIMNATGLFGSDNGWDLPGYPDASWTNVSLPDNWSARGAPAGIGWYRTTFSLHLPASSYVPVDVQIGGPGPGAGTANYRAFIYVNGWLAGRYVNNAGPQHQFYVPAGILKDDGPNTLAIAVWGLDQAGGGLDAVSLVTAGDQAGGLPIAPVASPGYNAAVYGAPTGPAPTLAAVPSTALATSSFTVKETLRDPAGAPLRDASLALNAPPGWTVTPSGSRPVGTVRPGSSASATFTVTAPSAGLSAGANSLLASATYDGTRSLLATATVNVPASSLAATFNNTGITDDSDMNPSADFTGFDGEGTSYSAQGLAADNLTPGATVSAGGLSFTWPDVPSAQPDNTMAQGQTIAVSGSGSTLGFLEAANNSAESGTGTIYYTDGTTQTFTLSAGNFWYASGANGNPAQTQVAAVNYANYPSGSSGHTIYVFEQNVALQSGKTIEAVTLPSLGSVAGYNPALHVFAMAVGG
ncbi:MAG TPA: beta-galactosidase [Trebonia sp.]|nr:beta-galactosidase [Trebonia sp.]